MFVDVIIRNNTAENIEHFRCNQKSVYKIIEWYSAFYAGDDYQVIINNKFMELDHNGQIIKE